MSDVFEHRICGIPCQIEIRSYEWADSGSDVAPPSGSFAEYRVLDRKGYPAPWLEKKVTARINEEILQAIDDYKEAQAEDAHTDHLIRQYEDYGRGSYF